MAISLPCKLGKILDSGCRFGRHFLANPAVTILKQMQETELNLVNKCSKNSREAGTEKEMYLAMLALKIKPYFILIKFLPWIFRTQTSLS